MHFDIIFLHSQWKYTIKNMGIFYMKTELIKNLIIVLIAFSIIVTLGACTSKNKTISDTDGFSVDGTRLLDANGNEFVFRGINEPHNWYKDKDETAIKAIAQTGANCIRIVLSNGYQFEKDSEEDVINLIELCKENEMIAILEVHDATGSNDLDALSSIVDYWIEIKNALIGNEAYVILNIANEWVGEQDEKLWEKGYTSAIPKIRDAGIKNTIMIDAAGWGQYAECIKKSGKAVFNSDKYKNTMFSIHMYGTAGCNEDTITKNLKYAKSKNLCVCVGEFGHTHSDGDVDEAYIMKYCVENNIGYLGWSWSGNSGGVEYLDIANQWDGSVLSPDWGEFLIHSENGIKQTAEKCSVF